MQDCRIVGMLVAQQKWISVFGMLLIQHAKATKNFFDGLQLSFKRPGFQKTSKELIFPNNSTFYHDIHQSVKIGKLLHLNLGVLGKTTRPHEV